MWKIILFVTGRILRSLATVMLVIPVSILLFDAMVVTLPVVGLGLSVSSAGVQDWFANNFSLLDVTYKIIAFLGVVGVALEFFFPNVKGWIVKLLSDKNKIFYLFLTGMTSVCVALFIYTLPSYIESGWPYGSKEAFIGVIGFIGIIHLFGSQWLFVYVALDKWATKLISITKVRTSSHRQS